MSKTPIDLKPVAGFCVKTNAVQPAVYTLPEQQNVLEPPLVIPIGFKVFINIAWDRNVPPPPPGNEDAIQHAMQGEDVDQHNSDAWYVPVVVSEGRQDKDKASLLTYRTNSYAAGKPSLVFDCIYNTSVKSRTLTDPEFKLFVVELALQRVEAQTSLVLSRQIGTPNIASKGKLLPRTVFVPSFLAANPAPAAPALPKPLIQEVTPSPTPKPKGILKTPPSATPNSSKHSRPTWRWSKENTKLQIFVSVPHLTRALIEQATLDIEPRRFIVQIPDCPVLDVNLDLSDAEIVATAPAKISASLHDESTSEPNNILTLKRQRDLDGDGATAEWRIAEGVLVITA